MAEVMFDHVTRIDPGNDKPSVDDLNLDIKDGEFIVLVGPSGCGDKFGPSCKLNQQFVMVIHDGHGESMMGERRSLLPRRCRRLQMETPQ